MATGAMTVTLYGRPQKIGRGMKQVTGHVVLAATSCKTSTVEKYFRRCNHIDFVNPIFVGQTSCGIVKWIRSATHKKGLTRVFTVSARNAVSTNKGTSTFIGNNIAASGTFVATGF